MIPRRRATPMKKEIEELADEAERQGFRVDRSGHHWKCFPPDRGRPMVTLSLTGYEGRSWQNSVAEMRRAGLVWPPPSKALQARGRPEPRLVYENGVPAGERGFYEQVQAGLQQAAQVV